MYHRHLFTLRDSFDCSGIRHHHIAQYAAFIASNVQEMHHTSCSTDWISYSAVLWTRMENSQGILSNASWPVVGLPCSCHATTLHRWWYGTRWGCLWRRKLHPKPAHCQPSQAHLHPRPLHLPNPPHLIPPPQRQPNHHWMSRCQLMMVVPLVSSAPSHHNNAQCMRMSQSCR